MAVPVDPLDAPMPTLGTPTHDSVMVSWAAVEGATSYSVNWTANGVTTSAPVGMAMEHNIQPHARDDVLRVRLRPGRGHASLLGG
jgi:hypothetical protein